MAGASATLQQRGSIYFAISINTMHQIHNLYKINLWFYILSSLTMFYRTIVNVWFYLVETWLCIKCKIVVIHLEM